MKVLAVIATKGGEGKTTTAANIGGFAADAGLRVLLVDLDVQPTLSSYFALSHKAAGGIYELLAQNEQRAEKIISYTAIPTLDLVLSNDAQGQLNTLLLHAADGRLRLRNLRRLIESDYDLMVIDTQGARSVLLEMAVLACDLALSPVTPEILAARELQRGTVQLMQDIAPFKYWGISLPKLHLVINRVHPVSTTARTIQRALRNHFNRDDRISILETYIPSLEAYPRASMMAMPVHRVERRKPKGRHAPAALETMRALMSELFPEWAPRFARVTGTASDIENFHG